MKTGNDREKSHYTSLSCHCLWSRIAALQKPGQCGDVQHWTWFGGNLKPLNLDHTYINLPCQHLDRVGPFLKMLPTEGSDKLEEIGQQ